MSTEPVAAIDRDSLERRTIKNSLRRIFADTLPDAVPMSAQPRRPALELEAIYKTLAEGLLHSNKRLEMSSRNTQRRDQTINAVETAVLNQIRVCIDGLKNLYSSAAAVLNGRRG